MTSTSTRARRIRAKGYEPVPQGWVPADFAKRIQAQIDAHAEEVEKAAETPTGSVGRPPKRETPGRI